MKTVAEMQAEIERIKDVVLADPKTMRQALQDLMMWGECFILLKDGSVLSAPSIQVEDWGYSAIGFKDGGRHAYAKEEILHLQRKP